MEAVRRCVLGSPEFPFVLKSYKKQKKNTARKKRQQVVRSTKIFEQKGRNPFILFKQTKHHRWYEVLMAMIIKRWNQTVKELSQ